MSKLKYSEVLYFLYILNKWILYADLSDIYLGEYNLNRFLKREGVTSDFNVSISLEEHSADGDIYKLDV